MSYEKIPQEIVDDVIRQQDEMGWPEIVPAFSECPAADGRMLWRHWDNLKPGICEQLVEFYARRAHTAMKTWHRTRTRAACRKAAKSILYARIYRCKYFVLMDKTDSTEADMPFPFMSEEGIKAMENDGA